MIPNGLKLYHYWRSSSSWRVRWALELKRIDCEFVPIDLTTDEPRSPAHLARNPMGFVPVLEIPVPGRAPRYLAESMAIIGWLEDLQPEPALLPQDPWLKARSRQLAEIINAGTQPLQNAGVAAFHSPDPERQKAWNQHWIHEGLRAYESLLADLSGRFSIGDEPTLADLFLIPQCYNAERHGASLEPFPKIRAIYAHALKTDECMSAAPERFRR